MLTAENGEQTLLSEAICVEKKPTKAATPEKKPVETKQPVPAASTSTACVTPTQTANEQERKIRFNRFILSFFPKLYDVIKDSWIVVGLVTFNDMEFVQLETGISDYVCYSCTGENLALIPMRDEVMGHLATLDNIKPADNQPYKADLMEMCVAKFNGRLRTSVNIFFDRNFHFRHLVPRYGNGHKRRRRSGNSFR